MAELSLARKVEKVLTAYLDAKIDDETLNVYEGHERAAAAEFPYLAVYAEDAGPHPEMPRETGVRIVALRCEFRVDSQAEEDVGRVPLDEWRMLLEDYLSDIEEIQTFIAASAIDWEGFLPHVYDMLPQNEPSAQDETDWQEQFVVGVVCQLTPVPD